MEKKIVSLFVCMVLVLSVAMPFCFATDGGFAGSGFGGGGTGSWGSNDYNLGYAGSAIGADSFVKYNETHPVTGADWQGLGALGLSAVTGDWNIAKDYFNGSGSASSGVGSSSGRPYNSTSYNGNTTNNTTNHTSFVTNNNNTSYFNTINNNQWITNQISNVYYNNEYNTYNIQTTNIENNYYVTYSPTYVTVLNYVPEQDIYDISCYYYQLPDGRNSFDLKAEDVWGSYFVYNAVNYPQVIEDEKTQALCHFDGDIVDSSAYKRDIHYDLGASYNYKSSNDFGQATLWDAASGARFLCFPLKKFGTNEDFTVEARFYFSPNTLSGEAAGSQAIIKMGEYGLFNVLREQYSTNLHLLAGRDTVNSFVLCPIPLNSWFSIAVVRQGTDWNIFLNGVKVKSYSNVIVDMNTRDVILSRDYMNHWFNSDILVDEVRISSGALYTTNYVPSTQPFDTNKVFVAPESGNENDIAIRSSFDVSDLRVGGVRPTYPTKGYVYVYVENNVIQSVQQYQNDGWYVVDAVVRKDGKWIEAKKFDLSDATLDKPTDPDSGGGGSSSVPDGGGSGGSGDSGDSLWTKFFDAVAGFIKKLVAFLASILTIAFDGLTTIFGKLFGLFEKLLTFPAQFTDFLSAAVPFVPAELWSIVLLGLTLSIVLMFIKFFRG